jgi:hypothetical protein
MNITLKRTPEQIELVQAMGSKNRDIAYEAQVALAEFIGPVINEVINNAPTLSNLFTPLQFNADDSPSIPLDIYYDVSDEDYINVYSTHAPGGLPTNQVTPTHSEMKIATYKLDTAVSFDKKYASRSRLDVVSKSFTRAAQEILLKQERTSGNLLLGALASGSTTVNGSATKHTIQSHRANMFILDDLNALLTRAKRIRPSWAGGTPVGGNAGITDIIVSPETVEDLREMAYNPINTRAVDGTVAAVEAGSAGIAAPDSVRAPMFQSAGIPEFYGISVMEIHELGPNSKFQKIWNVLDSSSVDNNPNGGDSAATVDDGDDLVLGIDRSRDAFVRAVAVDGETGGEFALVADDQYSIRQAKVGWFGSLEEGRVCLDDRALTAVAVSRS